MELKEFSPRIRRGINPTLGELLKCVEDAQSPDHDHHILELGFPCSSVPRSSYPFVLSFTNLTYSVKVGRKVNLIPSCFGAKSTTAEVKLGSSNANANTKVLLNGISGEAREGELMAVLGASGSGKSTLIDALADRISKDSLKGSITLNGEALDSRLLKVISAYVMQDDLLFPMLTVEETLMIVESWLKCRRILELPM